MNSNASAIFLADYLSLVSYNDSKGHCLRRPEESVHGGRNSSFAEISGWPVAGTDDVSHGPRQSCWIRQVWLDDGWNEMRRIKTQRQSAAPASNWCCQQERY